MRGTDIQYRCQACGQISLRKDLPRNSWGDPILPSVQFAPDRALSHQGGGALQCIFHV